MQLATLLSPAVEGTLLTLSRMFAKRSSDYLEVGCGPLSYATAVNLQYLGVLTPFFYSSNMGSVLTFLGSESS